jgi:hypothetical protein
MAKSSAPPAVRFLVLALAVALVPATALGEAAPDADLRLLPACNPLDPFAHRCTFIGSMAGLGRSRFSGERAPWSVPGWPAPTDIVRRAAYPIEAGGIRVVPSVVYLPDAAAPIPGVVSIGLERAAPGDPLRVRGELGWSGRPGGSFEVEYRESARQATLKAEQRPTGSLLPNGRTPGHTWDGAWTERLGARTSASLALTSDALDFAERDPESTSGRLELRHRATDALNLFVAVAGSSYADAASAALRRSSASIGTELRAGLFDITATYRGESSSLAPASGRGGRVSLRSSLGGWQARLYADAQQHAATVELDGAAQPDLPRELVDIGLAGASPEKAVRTLRDANPLLAQHAIELGALRIDPLRVQGGMDLRWRDAGPQRTEFAVLVAMDELQGTDAPRRALLGQLRLSWRMFGETDVSASYSNWSLQADPLQEENGSLFRLSLQSNL